MIRRLLALSGLALGFFILSPGLAPAVTPTPSPAPTCLVPYTFSPNTVAVAAQVNSNFSSLATCVDSILGGGGFSTLQCTGLATCSPNNGPTPGIYVPSPVPSSTGCGTLTVNWPNVTLNTSSCSATIGQVTASPPAFITGPSTAPVVNVQTPSPTCTGGIICTGSIFGLTITGPAANGYVVLSTPTPSPNPLTTISPIPNVGYLVLTEDVQARSFTVTGTSALAGVSPMAMTNCVVGAGTSYDGCFFIDLYNTGREVARFSGGTSSAGFVGITAGNQTDGGALSLGDNQGTGSGAVMDSAQQNYCFAGHIGNNPGSAPFMMEMCTPQNFTPGGQYYQDFVFWKGGRLSMRDAVEPEALGQVAARDYAGSCTMSGTSCTFNITHTYGTALCFTTEQGTGAIAGSCALSTNTVTITAASSNTGTWAAMIVGNPE